MARFARHQSAFNAGELSPRLVSRDDFDRYDNGLSVCLNMVPLAQGAVRRRAGTRFVHEVKDSGQPVRLIPFVFNDEQAYVIEAGEFYFRFYTREAQLLTTGGAPVEVATPYTTAELMELDFAQSADVLYLVHPNHEPRKLTRTTPTSFSLVLLSFFDGPFNAESSTDDGTPSEVTVTPSAGGSGSITMTASGDLFTDPDDVGRLFRVKSGTNRPWAYGVITAVNSTTEAVVDIAAGRPVGGGATVADRWRLGAFKVGNYPATVTIHEERLLLGGDPAHPSTFYGSVIGDFENFCQTGQVLRRFGSAEQDGQSGTVYFDPDTVTDENAYAFTLGAKKVHKIQWMESADALFIGTFGGSWLVQGAERREAITPLNVNARRTSGKGAAQVQPVVLDNAVLYVSLAKRRAYLAAYDLQVDTIVPVDVSVVAEHFGARGFTDLAYVEEPLSTVWLVAADGSLVGFTYQRAEDIAAWHQHVLGGGGSVEAVASIPEDGASTSAGAAENLAHDQLWLVVQRTIDGVPRRYVEFMEDDFVDTHDLEDAFFVDAGLSYEGVPTTTLAGLGHLEGAEVTVLADGSPVEAEILAGVLTLSEAASRIHVGLAYTHRGVLLDIVPRDVKGSARGAEKRADRLVFRLDRSLGGMCRSTEAEAFIPLLYAQGGDPMGEPPALFTGELVVPTLGGWTPTLTPEFQSRDPLPFTLTGLSVLGELSAQGGSP